ncbi:hypothetical protein HK098_003950 [Nowakowskiella sp. JEL0407]|nr:hypothetical protein HK098_003950 [Nowakowskiella sp. JEL0407]
MAQGEIKKVSSSAVQKKKKTVPKKSKSQTAQKHDKLHKKLVARSTQHTEALFAQKVERIGKLRLSMGKPEEKDKEKKKK